MVSETETVSWFSRLRDALGGLVAGVVLVPVALFLLFWNEGRAVKEAQALEEGAKNVVAADPAAVDAAKEGRLVHLIGLADPRGELADPAFAVSARALRLRRKVEMYQWRQSEGTKTIKNVGGSQTN